MKNKLIHWAALLFSFGIQGSNPVFSQEAYPSRSVTIVVPFTAGQSGDILARILAESLSKIWGKGVVVDNRPGVGGVLGSQIVMRAPADGYTLLLSSSGPMAIAPNLNVNANYDPRKDFTPIMNVAGVAQALVVPENSPFKIVQDLIKAAKASPGKLNYGSGGAPNSRVNHGALANYAPRSSRGESYSGFKSIPANATGIAKTSFHGR